MAGEEALGKFLGQTLNKNAQVKEDLTGSSSDLNFVVLPELEDVGVEERTIRIKKENWIYGFVIGHQTYGKLGSSVLGKSTTTEDYLILNTYDTFKEYVLTSDFIETSAVTATTNLTNQRIDFSGVQDFQSKTIYQNTNISNVKLTLPSFTVNSSNLSISVTTDNSYWQPITNDILTSLVITGSLLKYLIRSSDISTIYIKNSSNGEYDPLEVIYS